MLHAIALTLPPVVWTFACAAFLTVGDILFRTWLHSQWTAGFAVTFAFYAIGTLCMMMSFFGQGIAVATVAAVIANIVAYLLASWWLYGDAPNLMQIVGIILGFAVIAILELA